MGRVRWLITAEAFLDAFNAQYDCVITGARFDNATGVVVIDAENPRAPVIPEGSEPQPSEIPMRGTNE